MHSRLSTCFPSYPRSAIMTHASVPAANRKRLGISDGLVRLSVGVEDIADLRAELTFALGS